MSTTDLFPTDELLAELFEHFEKQDQAALDAVLEKNPHLIKGWQRELDRLQRYGLLGSPTPPLGSDYKILGKLGKGGMGVVYLAEKLPYRRKVAVKTIRPSLLRDPRVRERFRREAQMIAGLRHEGIVPLLEFCDKGEIPFYAMEWVNGRPLAGVLEAFQGMSPQNLCGLDMQRCIAEQVDGAEAGPAHAREIPTFRGSWEDACIRLVWQTAEALQYAHGKGVIHRDVKPSNIVLTPGGTSLLLDFGLASLKGGTRLTGTGCQVGTLAYLPPEHLEGRERSLDEKGDIYSLGITLYELLTLRLPFSAPSPGKTIQLILQGHPPRPRNLNSALTEEIESVCLRAIARDPRMRYASMKEFVADLAKVMDGQKVRKSERLWQQVFSAARAHPNRFWSLVALLAFVLGLCF